MEESDFVGGESVERAPAERSGVPVGVFEAGEAVCADEVRAGEAEGRFVFGGGGPADDAVFVRFFLGQA